MTGSSSADNENPPQSLFEKVIHYVIPVTQFSSNRSQYSSFRKVRSLEFGYYLMIGVCSSDFYNLYLNFLKRSFLQVIPSSFSMPFGEEPSITPRTPLPSSDWARITSTGFAVAQKTVQTS